MCIRDRFPFGLPCRWILNIFFRWTHLYNSGTYAKNYLILFEFAAVIVCHRKKIYRQTHRHFSKKDFFHVLSVVQSESAIISNTIFLPSPYFHFLKEMSGKLPLSLNRSSPKTIGLYYSAKQGCMQKRIWFGLNLWLLSFTIEKNYPW